MALVVLLALALATPRSARAAPDAPAVPVVPPVLTSTAEVPYPDGATGTASVVLVVTVNADGTVRDASVETPNPPFSDAAIAAARGWHYTPALRDGKPVAAKIKVAIAFQPPVVEPVPAAVAPPPPVVVAGARPPKRDDVEDVTVRGAHPDPGRSVSLGRAEVRQLPGAFGDPFRAIEIMPGVTPIVSGLPYFFVRGAPPGDVGYFVDGIRVPYLFHVGAGPSVVHPALIDRVDLYPGGYPARFGRFSGGIVSGETMAPPDKARGEANLRVFDAGALIDVPFAGGRGELLAGGRYSFTGLILSLFSPDTVLQYWDYQLRAGYDLSKKDRVGLFAFGAFDFLGQKQTDGTTSTVFGAQFHRLELRWDHRLGGDAYVRTSILGGLDLTEIQAGNGIRPNLRDRLVGARTELVWRMGPNAVLRAGADAQLDTYDVVLPDNLPPSAVALASFFPTRTDLNAGVRADLVLKPTRRFEMIPGLRLDYYSSGGAAAIGVDPRLAVRTVVTNRIRLLGAMGLAHQAPSFVIPVPGFQPGGLRGGLQTALQESLALEVDLGFETTATATVFHNAFFDLSDALSVNRPQASGCAPGTFPEDTLAGDRATQPVGNATNCGTARFAPGTVGPDRSGGGGQGADSTGNQRAATAFETRADGSSFGLELMVKRKLTSKLGGFVSYTLSRSVRRANGQEFVASFDRTHVFNAAVSYDFGKGWRAGVRFTAYSGLPRAPDPTSDATRLDAFFRLDVRGEKKWTLGKGYWLALVAEWLNVTMTKESFGTSCTLNGCTENKIGPITIPSLGLEGGF
jgi:TonB family protein